MDIIIGPRGSGKTTELVKRAIRYGYTIVCTHEVERKSILKKVNIPYYNIITYDQFLNQSVRSAVITKGLLIDNINLFIYNIIKHISYTPIEAITLDLLPEDNLIILDPKNNQSDFSIQEPMRKLII